MLHTEENAKVLIDRWYTSTRAARTEAFLAGDQAESDRLRFVVPALGTC